MKNSNQANGASMWGILFLVVIILLTLNYFHLSIKIVAENPTGKHSQNSFQGTVENVWDTYVQKPATYVWKDLWLPIWNPFISNIQHTLDNAKTDTNPK